MNGPALQRSRRAAVAGAVAFVVIAVCGCQREPAHYGRAPILFFLVDTLRADYLGAYGFKGDVSPQIDRLAAEGVLFRNCFAQAPWTKPSIASLFTSLRVPVHRVVSHNGQFGMEGRKRGTMTETLSDAAVTLAEGLQRANYATAAFIANPWLLGTHGFAQGFDDYNDRLRGNGVTADRVLRAVSKWMEKVPTKHGYFAYIHLMDVHGPYDAPAHHFEAIADSVSLGESAPLEKHERKRIPVYLQRGKWFRNDSADARVMRGHYAAGVRALDERLGAFFDELRRNGLWDKAIVVFTSDHGEQLHEHGGWDHGHTLYDEELHVPLIVKLPGGRYGGRDVADVVSLIDVMPTVLALAGAPAVTGMQGRNLTPLLSGDDVPAAPGTFATAVKWKPGLHSARTGRYKLIKDTTGPQTQLFDLEQDPGEQHALMDAGPALAAAETLLQGQFADNDSATALEPGKVELSPEMDERLRSLGYD